MKNILLITLTCSYLFANSQSGITWSPSVTVATGYGNFHPRMALDANGNPLVIWGRMSDESVYIARWTGTAFTVPVKVNPVSMTIATQTWMGPDIASKGDTVYVVMKRTPEALDTNHIYITRSFDGGMTFSAPSQVDIGDSITRFPTVTIDDSGNPIVAFMKFNMTFMNAHWVVAKSSDYGNTFSNDVTASGWSGGVVCDCCPGSLIHSGNVVAMSYRDNLNNLREMWTGISNDDGNTFQNGINIDQTNWMLSSCPSSGPDGIIIGDSLYTTWMSSATGMALVYRSSSSISNLQAGQSIPLTGNFTGLTLQNFPRMANSGSAVAISWKQHVNTMDQLALQFTNNIAGGFPSSYDTIAMGTSITNTDVALTNGNIFIVWEDDISGTVKFRKGTFSPLATGELAFENDYAVFPNPVSAKINIGSKDFSYAELFSPGGQKICEIKTANPDFSELTNGIYFLRIVMRRGVALEKIVVRH